MLAEYYSYLKQPFLDLRELSFEKSRQAEVQLDSADVGERVKEKLRELRPKWDQERRDSEESLRELHVDYFAQSRKVLAGKSFEQTIVKRESDRDNLSDLKESLEKELKLVKSVGDGECWALVRDLLNDLELRASMENVSYLNAKLSQSRSRKRGLCSQVCFLFGIYFKKSSEGARAIVATSAPTKK